MKWHSNYFYWVMLVINIVFATYFINNWLFAKPTLAAIPSNLLTENNLVKAQILKLTENSANKQIALALMSSQVGVCADNKIVDIFRAIRSEKPKIMLYILFPKDTSDQDISTFKDNFRLDFEVRRMDSELDDYWEQISQKYQASGIIILSNQNKIFVSQNVSEIKNAIEAY